MFAKRQPKETALLFNGRGRWAMVTAVKPYLKRGREAGDDAM